MGLLSLTSRRTTEIDNRLFGALICTDFLFLIWIGYAWFHPELIATIQKYICIVIPVITVYFGIRLAWSYDFFYSRAIPCYFIAVIAVIVSAKVTPFLLTDNTGSGTDYPMSRCLLIFCSPALICGVLLAILSYWSVIAGRYEWLMLLSVESLSFLLCVLSATEYSVQKNHWFMPRGLIVGSIESLVFILPLYACALPYLLFRKNLNR